MDSDTGRLAGTILLAALLLTDFIMTAFHAAMDAASDAELQSICQEAGKTPDRVLELKDRPGRMVSANWLTHTAACIAAGVLGVCVYTGAPLFLTLPILLVVCYLIGNSVPRMLGRRYLRRFVLSGFSSAGAVMTVLFPFTYLLTLVTNLFAKLFGIDPHAFEQEVTEDEIISMVNEGHEQGVLDAKEAEMIQNIFELDDKKAEDIMTRRKNIIDISGTTNLRDAIAFMVEQTVSRFPVYDDNIDNIIGVLHFKDAMKFHTMNEYDDWQIRDIPELLRKVRFIPETRGIHDLFRSMQAEKLQMVIVVDEYGQTAGLVTMEDILEEIVGNIQDEYDNEQPMIRREADGVYLMDGMAPLDEVVDELGLSLEDDEKEYDTLNGLLISRLDRIPADGEQAEVMAGGYRFQIVKVENKMIRLVKITKYEEQEKE